MNEKTTELLLAVMEAVKGAVNTNFVMCIMAGVNNEPAALWSTDADDYWTDPAGFERAVYSEAEHGPWVRGIFVAPVISRADDDLMIRPNDHEIEEGETEQLMGIAFDFTDGVDIVSQPIGRRPNGEAVYGEPRILTSPVELSDRMPGYGLYARMLTPIS